MRQQQKISERGATAVEAALALPASTSNFYFANPCSVSLTNSACEAARYMLTPSANAHFSGTTPRFETFRELR